MVGSVPGRPVEEAPTLGVSTAVFDGGGLSRVTKRECGAHARARAPHSLAAQCDLLTDDMAAASW